MGKWVGYRQCNFRKKSQCLTDFKNVPLFSGLLRHLSPRLSSLGRTLAKYLGITITESMDWGQHISDISSKATKTLGFLRRNLAFALRSTKELHTKLWYFLNWSMQPPFGAHIVKLRFNKWRRYRGRQPAGPAGGGATLVVLEKCSMSCNGQLWRPGGISPLCFSSTRFIMALCLLIKTST